MKVTVHHLAGASYVRIQLPTFDGDALLDDRKDPAGSLERTAKLLRDEADIRLHRAAIYEEAARHLRAEGEQ